MSIVTQIGPRLLTTFSSSQGKTRISWAEAKRLGATNQACGELRNDQDVRQMPVGVALRAVYLPHDASIRWANPNASSSPLSGKNHDHLACAGDRESPTKQGYIIVKSDGTVRVTNKHGQ